MELLAFVFDRRATSDDERHWPSVNGEQNGQTGIGHSTPSGSQSIDKGGSFVLSHRSTSHWKSVLNRWKKFPSVGFPSHSHPRWSLDEIKTKHQHWDDKSSFYLIPIVPVVRRTNEQRRRFFCSGKEEGRGEHRVNHDRPVIRQRAGEGEGDGDGERRKEREDNQHWPFELEKNVHLWQEYYRLFDIDLVKRKFHMNIFTSLICRQI